MTSPTAQAEQLWKDYSSSGTGHGAMSYVMFTKLIARALRQAQAETWREAVQVAMAEEELEGLPPKKVLDAMKQKGWVESARATVRTTKKAIAAKCEQRAQAAERGEP